MPPKPEEATHARNPVGGVHASIGDLARWAAAYIAPSSGTKPFFGAETIRVPSKESRPGTGAAPGWFVANVEWAKGAILFYEGCQGRNFALVHVVPEEGYATCVATNVAGLPDREGDRACQEVHLSIVNHLRSERRRK